ncbi:SHOCT domain-containing protein [Pseudoalteromonas sp.]|uniref:SHOCT domain-containing protein n=1 Tax=Pseudoalteromonas sp. TaxID=53249 RepID=UPI0035C72445
MVFSNTSDSYTPLTVDEKIKVLIFLVLLVPPSFLLGIGFIPLLALIVAMFATHKTKDFAYYRVGYRFYSIYSRFLIILAIGMFVFHSASWVRDEMKFQDSLEKFEAESQHYKAEQSKKLKKLESEIISLETKLYSSDFAYDVGAELDKISSLKEQVKENKLNLDHPWRPIYSSYHDDDSKALIVVSIFMIIVVTIYLALFNRLFVKVTLKHEEWIEKEGLFLTNKKSQTPKPSSAKIFKHNMLNSYSVADELLKWAKLKDDGVITNEEFESAKRKILSDK